MCRSYLGTTIVGFETSLHAWNFLLVHAFYEKITLMSRCSWILCMGWQIDLWKLITNAYWLGSKGFEGLEIVGKLQCNQVKLKW
jgi:hypothetical protein